MANIIEDGGIYKLVNAEAGNVVDLSELDGQSVIGYDYYGSDSQKVCSSPRRMWRRSVC